MMELFKEHKIRLADIINEIPESELIRIAKNTNADKYSKVLSGKLMFYLMLYGMLYNDALSQRGLKEAFSSPLFRELFNYQGKPSISHSSISERLSIIELDFFKQVYELLYRRFSSLYTEREISNKCLQRVDSTLVKESCNKLKEGLTCGNSKTKGKMLKYTLNFDGMFASFGSVHKEERYASESLALPENVMSHFKKEDDHSNVYIFDRGQGSVESFKQMKTEEGLFFVGRLLENRRREQIEVFDVKTVKFSQGQLLEDGLVQLYKRVEVLGKNGKMSRRSELVDETFRTIRFRPANQETEIVLITNLMDLPADKIAEMYRRRWDIEVFFRFLKQELNFSHFLSLNDNGIQVVLYMTMITAMLVMIYKKENQIGFLTAKRRIKIEIEGLVLAILILQNGGDLKKKGLPDP